MRPEADLTPGDQPTVDFRATDRDGTTWPDASPFPAPAPASASGGRGSNGYRVEVVSGSGVRLPEATRALLRDRLRAVSLAMTFAFGAFLARNLAFGGLYLDPLLVVLHSGVVGAFLAAFLVLSGPRPVGLRSLRTLELVLFAMTAVFFATTHSRIAHLRAASGDQVMLMATVKNAILFAFAMVVLYGMFIPATWRRAAAVVVGMTAITLLGPVALHALAPGAFGSPAFRLGVEVLSENVMMLAIGAGTTVYAASVIHNLRVEAFEARRLNQYRLKGRLGAGGMGVVYLAEHQMLKRPCALKLIAPTRAADPAALAGFEREVRVTARLSHPNTVEIYDYGRTDDGRFYYVMERLEGLSLAELVERHGPLPPGRVVFLLRQVCGALAEAHASGLVHRDLKPANVFAARRGNLFDFAKLLDFGLVLPPEGPAADSSEAGHIAGSPMYMAPEQAAGLARPDARADVYGVGAVAYHLLTGRAPFAGRTAAALLAAAARATVEPPSRHRPGLPPDLEAVVLRCLAKSPSDRFRDADALERALAACASADEWDFAHAADWWQSAAMIPSPA